MNAITCFLRAASLCLCLAVTSPAFAGITFVNKTTGENNSGPTLSLASPQAADLVANRFLIAQITFQKGSGIVVTPPAGWNLAKRDNIDVQGQDLGQVVFWKRVPNGEAAQNYVFDFEPAVKAAGTLLLYSGVDTTEPFVTATGNTRAGAGMTATSMVGLGLDADANSLLVAVYGMKRQTALVAETGAPAGMTQRATETNTLPVTTWAFDQMIGAAGATGNRTAVVPNPGAIWIAQLLNIRNGEGRANVWDPGTRLEASANSAPVAGSVNVTVRVADVDGNPVAGVPVEFFVDSADATFGDKDDVTLADGSYTTTLTSTKAGIYNVTARFDGADADLVADISVISGSPQAVEFYSTGPVDLANAGTKLEITDPAAIANGADTGAARVSLADQYGNPIRDFAVRFEASGSAGIAAADGITAANGTYATTFTNQVAQAVNVRARVDLDGDDTLDGYVSIGDNGQIVFSAGPVATATFAIGDDEAVANGTDAGTASLVLEDAFGNRVPNVPVSFASTGSGSVTASGTVSDGNGSVSASITNLVAEVVTVSASYGATPTVAGSGPITFVAGPVSATTSTIAATDPSAIANGTDAGLVTVTLKDANGNPVEGVTVSLTKTGAGTLALSSGPTDASGEFVAGITSTTPGTAVVTASYDVGAGAVAVDGDAQVTFTNGPPTAGNPDTKITTVTATAPADGTSQTSVLVTVLDATGNPVAGVDVAFADDSAAANVSAAAAATNAQGQVSATLTSASAGAVNVTAQFDSDGANGPDTAVNGTAVVTFTGLVDAAQSDLAATDANAIADGVDFGLVVATLRNAGGDPVANVKVEFTASGSATVTALSTSSGVDGSVSAEIRNLVAGVTNVTARYDADNDGTVDTDLEGGAAVQVTFVAGPVSLANLGTKIEATDPIALADGVDTGTARVTLLDANDNPVQGVEVAFSLTGSGSLTAATGVTDAQGQFSTNVTSTVIGNVTVTAMVDADDDAQDTTEAAITNGSAVVAFGEFDTDASIEKRVTRALTLSNGSGDNVEYTIVVRNVGQTPIFDADVLDAMPAQLANVAWTCSGTAGGTCTAAGAGDIADVVDLPVGASVTYVVTGFAATVPSGGFLNQAAVDAANDIDPSNDVSGALYQRCAPSLQVGAGTGLVTYVCMFRDGFENATAN